VGIWSEAVVFAVGVILVICGLRLVFKEQTIVDPSGNVIDIKVSTTGGHLRSRSSALVVLIVGSIFIAAPPLARKYLSPPMFRISGRIQLHEGTTVSGLQGATIGILPTHVYTTGSIPDGSYFIDVPKGSDGESYQAVVQVNSNPPMFYLGVVDFDSSGRGRFDHTFDRSKK